MSKANKFSDAFSDRYFELIEATLKESDEVREHILDPKKNREVNLELDRLKIKQGLIKQANNVYKNTLSKHVAASKYKDFPVD